MSVQLFCGDCLEILPTLEAGSIDMLLTDPPYRKQDGWVWPLLGQQGVRLLADGRSLVTLCGHYNIPEVIDGLQIGGLRYWWMAGMRHTKNRRLPGKWVTTQWEPAVWMVKSKRRGTRTPYDMLAGGGRDKEHHGWGKPVRWFQHWIENLTEPGEVVLDPFMGSGTTGVACMQTGRNFIGIEIEPTYFAIAEKRIAEARAQMILPLEMG